MPEQGADAMQTIAGQVVEVRERLTDHLLYLSEEFGKKRATDETMRSVAAAKKVKRN